MPHDEVINALANYHINILTGDGSQCIRVVQRLAQLPEDQGPRVNLSKITYTSEPLTRSQRDLIRLTLGDITICSVMGSSEAGPWAIRNPNLTGEPDGSAVDFVFDSRNVIIETLPHSVLDDNPPTAAEQLQDGEHGIIVQASLQRLRNPLVRYVTGHIGSLKTLPERARALIPDSDWEYLRELHMQGRDKRFSFKWYGSYFNFVGIDALMDVESRGILQWQLILDRCGGSAEVGLEIRLLRAAPRQGIVPHDELVREIEQFFLILNENRDLFRLVFVDDLTQFERSATAGKVIKFIDRVH